ncbi:integral membrane sensor signal transduction histidine kinase [Parafrankia sp. EAN1pec]|uniref:ATP-binding protein n=1 Tax=Parafrankia sp. (strain EAN1pec) TaxID=298653 RepID=UPI00005429EE|nr:integral membrane sensor signal transduction histidine kinase [Frankia sp. EAN1pec]
MPLRVRLTLLFVLGTTLVLAAAGVLFYALLRTNLRNSVDANLRTRMAVLAAQVPAAADPAAQLRAYGAGPAQLLRPDGSVAASNDSAGPEPLLEPAQVATALARSESLTSGELREPGGDDDDARALAVPVRTGARDGVLVVATSTDLTDSAEDRVRNIMVSATAPMVALSGLAAWLLSGAALRPVDRMRRQTAAISESDSSAELDVPPTRDEIAALAATMNNLLRRLHAARARDRAFVADAGHELRTPLTNLKAELELAGRPARTRDELVDAVAGAAEETERLIRLSESLLTLARMDSGITAPRRLDAGDLLERAARAATGHAETRQVRLHLDADPGLAVDADPDMLRQAVDNLVANAIRHAPPGTAVDVRAGPGEAGRTVVVRVRDRGPGFPPDFLPRAFERFSRADAARTRDHGGTGTSGNSSGTGLGGTGLGLAIAAAVARAHQGTATAANHPDGGAVVTLTLPAAGGLPPDR